MIQDRLTEWLGDQERRQRLAKRARWFFLAIVLSVLVYQLTGIGWDEILRSLPTSPWFYLIFLVLYFSLPLSEALVYRKLWGFRYLEGFAAFLKKRVLNKDVLGYSGDVYLYLWAREKAFLPEKAIRGAVKDNAIVSSAASTLFAVTVLVGLFLTGRIAWANQFRGHEVAYGVALLLIGGIVAALAYRFQHVLFYLSRRMLVLLFGIHWARLLLTNVLQVVQWSIVMPEASWTVWGTLLAVQIVVSRISFLPARDLIFISASMEASRLVDVSTAGIAGMLVVSNVLDKLLNLVLFSATTFLDRRAPLASAEPAEPTTVGTEEP